ncbi:uncharacterized protein N7477_008417 [Penicillium maclennaniae]|uniref:uncharacterized protein n=1 Tax=Penicillium maclennaniae TaxID=1343394 RepID=UPI00253FD1DD|nr:uncharacterized protein N7477_008417 [Penicillium maclennaniae]KAJ5665969.1 hypothetical protein N7477_008417 [Penicillium maclennaniae]
MEYMIRLAQCHETFRVAELQAVATVVGVDLEIVSYDEYSPYCIVKLENDEAARKLISRTILAKDISELWGQGTNYDELHADVKKRTSHRWADYNDIPFAFALTPPLQFIVMEEYIGDTEASALGVSRITEPRKVFLGRFIANSARDAIDKYDLKKRQYISTTSMDAELSLVTANMALAAPGKVLYDPFVGTGSFMVAASHFGALTFGSDIDPRSFRGKDEEKGMGKNVQANFKQYGIESKFLDTFTSDLTNTPLRNGQLLDGIICDPPYGVREGLRVLGTRNGKAIEPVVIDGVLNYYRPGYIPPKRPYGFEALQRDILDFAVRSLVPGGRLTMWMPTTNDEAKEFPVPMHPNLEVIAVSVQHFGNWARRLMTYRRLPEGEASDISKGRSNADQRGITADELNGFRRKYLARNDTPDEGRNPTQ